jgi:hypothetical protein
MASMRGFRRRRRQLTCLDLRGKIVIFRFKPFFLGTVALFRHTERPDG